MQAGSGGSGNLLQAASNLASGVSGIAPAMGNPDGKARRQHRAKSDLAPPTTLATGGNGNGANGAPLQKNGTAFSSSESMAGVGGVLSSFTNASKAVVSAGQAATNAAPGAASAIGAAERLARASKEAVSSAQAAVAGPGAARSDSALGRVLQTDASSASLGMAARIVGSTASAPNTGDAAPQRRRHSSRHSSGRHSSRHSSSVGGSSAAPSRRSGRGRHSGEQSDYASDASGASSHGGRSRNGGGRASSAHGPMDPKEKEQRRARRAMRKYTSAFKFENGREPTTDEDWHPLKRTRALLKEGGANFPSSKSSSPLKQRAGWGAALRGAGANGGDRQPRPSSEIMTVAAPLKAVLALSRLSDGKELSKWEGASEMPPVVTPPPPPGIRKKLRTFLTKTEVEVGMLVSVVMYGMFVFFDLGVGLLAADWWRLTWSKIIDSAFLLFFVVELIAKLFAFGHTYITSSPLNMVDAFAITLCAGLFVLDDVADTLNLSKVAPEATVESRGVEGLDQSSELTAGEQVQNDEKMAGVLLLLRLVRVVRLGAVMVRTMNMSTKLNMARDMNSSRETHLSGLQEALDNKLSGWRGTIVARRWEKIRREEAARPDIDVIKIADETRDFLQRPENQDVVKLLTGNFQTLINVFQKLDKTRDGSLDCQEFIPGMIGLGLSPEVAEKFFLAIDVDGTGGVEVAELFRTGAFLRGGGGKAPVPTGVSPSKLGVSASEVKLTNGVSSTSAADGVAQIGIVGVAGKQMPSSADRQRKLDVCKAKLKNKISWWTQERWDPSYEMRSTLRYLKPTKMADAKVRIRMAPPYIFKAGQVEVHSAPPHHKCPHAPASPPSPPHPPYLRQIRDHFNGSGAMLETRIQQLMTLFEVTLADVGELSRKLQEIEVGQPKQALEWKDEIIIYRTYLEGLVRAIPAARLRVEPFRNDNSKVRSWQALAPNSGSVWRVQEGGNVIGPYLFFLLCLRFLHLVMVHTEWDGVESGHLRRKTCELLLSLNTTSAEIPTITLQLTEEAESLSQQTLRPGFCDADDPYFVLYGAAVLAPMLSMIGLPAFFVIFKANINPTALQQARPAS